MRRPIIAALIIGAATLIGACHTVEAEDAGPVVKKDFKVGDFKRIESAGSYDVTVTTGSAPSVQAEGPENVLANLVVEVKGDELRIHPDKSQNFRWGKSGPVKIAVTVPELHGASLAGSGNLSVDKVAGESFEGNIAGSADFMLPQVDVQSLKFNIAGSGSANVGGKAANAEYSIAGSGDLDAANLQSTDVKISIAGSGNVKAQASGTVSGAVMGSGDAVITGGAKCNVTKMGSGSINCS
jgi:hypothetical protein